MTEEEAIEKLVQNLYLVVGGAEIDRLRIQIKAAMDVPFGEIGPEEFVVCAGDENHHIVFTSSWEEAEALLLDPKVKFLLNGRSSVELSGVAVLAHRRYYIMESDPQEAPELDMLCAILMALVKLERPGTVRDPARRLLLMNLGYRQIDGKEKVLFTSLWKKNTGLSHG